jgi:hypothetical protein
MRGPILTLASWTLAFAINSVESKAQTNRHPALPPPIAGAEHRETVDGIAARIEDDILAESEVNELAAFQTLVDGHSQSRSELIRELADQWILRGEAAATKYPEPSPEDVDAAYAKLQKQFPSPEEFKNRCAALGLAPVSVRRLLAQQLYLSRFLDFRFRPAAQVDQQQIAAFYKDDFAAQLKKQGQAVPPIEEVEDTIREVLIQRAINDRATMWLDETRGDLRIDVLPEENLR